ncbi:immunoglobulin-binding protein [Salmonella enterica subsp. enterica serovar Infantis]|nr:immunoglobulin-binding protein [Salmonella enterica subsp. enterica serovar Infantis]
MLPEDVTLMLSRWLSEMGVHDRIAAVNSLHRLIHQYSPFHAEPVDCIQWIPAERINAEACRPDTISPVDRKRLEMSLLKDGFTQPVVVTAGRAGTLRYQVVDGFQRYLLSQKPALRKRLHGHIPVASIRTGYDVLTGLTGHSHTGEQRPVAAIPDRVCDLSPDRNRGRPR